jgi:hypothetical protein
MFRLFIFIVLLTSIFLFPYWVYLPLVLIAVFYFNFFWEAVILGYIIDKIYAGGMNGHFLFLHAFSISALFLVMLSMSLRERFRL